MDDDNDDCYYLCRNCERHVSPNSKKSEQEGSSSSSSSSSSSPTKVAATNNHTCLVCLGVWDDDNNNNNNHEQSSFRTRLTQALKTAVLPYSSSNHEDNQHKYNSFCRRAVVPTVVLPGDMMARHEAVAAAKRRRRRSPQNHPQRQRQQQHTAVVAWAQEIKAYTKHILDKTLDKIESNWHSQQQQAGANRMPSPVLQTNEEMGHLAVHVIVTVANDGIPRPKQQQQQSSKHKRQRCKRRKMHGPSQGGDPRQNLELRLFQEKGITIWSLNQALDKSRDDDSNNNNNNDPTCQEEEKELLQPLTREQPAYAIHVAVWRRPFYVRGEYTKIRRDVSQTPFYVQDNPDEPRRRLGVSSVEEEILPVLIKYCGGISIHNNNHPATANKSGSSNNGGSTTIFGMAKFHASGREDMDVRMILPPPSLGVQEENTSTTTSTSNNNKHITGRPFVCEVTDAYRLPSSADLERVVLEINHVESIDQALAGSKLSYGQNPNGVGIAPGFQYVPSASFKNLQADTEDKVKHYGCLCWSRDVLPDNNAALRDRLGTFPLALEQRTPIRVLHRRSNLIRHRNVLSCRVQRIDDHYFRLHISTDAGTYVKEFVHGDLGRTKPSIASILGCKADILELDCEGIQSG